MRRKLLIVVIQMAETRRGYDEQAFMKRLELKDESSRSVKRVAQNVEPIGSAIEFVEKSPTKRNRI